MDENKIKVSEDKEITKTNKLSIPSAIIVAGLIIAGAVFFTIGPSNKLKPNQRYQNPSNRSTTTTKTTANKTSS